jgi:cell volume regulation protein A
MGEMLDQEAPIAFAALLVLAGVIASKISSRLGVPALLLFLGVGMVTGSDVLGWISFDEFELARTIGVFALAFILFAGGLDTEWSKVRNVAAPAVALATVGVGLTAVIVGLVAAWALDVPLLVGLLIGAIVSSTDAAAVFSVLRSRSVSLRGRLRPLLELESGSNDPMAVFLTIGLIELVIRPEQTALALVPMFFNQMIVGLALGLVFAKLTVMAINRLRLEYDGLYPVVTLSVVILTYAATVSLGGSGFLAVYVCGLAMGNADFLHKRSLIRFHDAIGWLAQISMFLVLGLLVFPSQLPEVALPALIVAAALVAVARPAAVMATLAVSRFSWQERLMVSWVGLRGAAPIILATFPLVAGVSEAALIFNVVLFVVLISVMVQGTSIPWVARRLGVDAPLQDQRPYPLEAVYTGDGDTSLHELWVESGAVADGGTIIDLAMPDGSLVVLISRDDDFVVPQGSTKLKAGDRVLVLADDAALPQIRASFSR